MIPLVTLGRATATDGRPLELLQRGDSYFLHLDRYPLLASDASACERAMAEMAARHLRPRRKPRVLLDGLGLGILARETLAILKSRAEVIVAEPNLALKAWHEELLVDLTQRALADERLKVESASLESCLGKMAASLDSVVIDLDFSVSPFLRRSKSASECRGKFALAKQALRTGGRIVLRSVDSEPVVVDTLRDMGFRVDEQWLSPVPSGKARRQCLTLARLS